MLKMVTYPGMSLRGEVRESISLDEDDLSDVEDEVFIRDGKNGYKLAEELNVKRPLMAPRRKIGKPDLGSRLKQKPPCREFCKPCCYALSALSVLIGLIALVVVLVSIYPLPLDKLRDWVISKPQKDDSGSKLLPCTNLKVVDVWSVNLPKMTTDSPIRTLDVNGDDVEDILFGFGTGYNENVLPPEVLCPIFMGVPPPCEGGIIALNGLNGDILWRYWLNDTIFNLHCTADIDGDQIFDCLAVGAEGTITVVNAKTGQPFWQLNTGKMNIFVANFIDDQNNDNVSDIITSHSSLEDKRDGHIVLISGKNGDEIRRIKTPEGVKTYFMPQILKQDENETFVIFGTGSPTTPGNLSAVPLKDIVAGNLLENNTKLLYHDNFKGILTQVILVDITGDNVPDIITSTYNSTVVAINGKTFQQIWNYTVLSPITETNISPTPGYFNFDNVTDFLIVYQKYNSVFNNNYTQTYIIDGKTGQPIYNPFRGGLLSQMSGLTLSMESYGYDFFLFWSECVNTDNLDNLRKNDLLDGITDTIYDECKRHSNMSTILKLNALNQNHQPPGFVIYNSEERISTEYNTTTSVLHQLKNYLRNHPNYITAPTNQGQAEIQKNYNLDSSAPIGITKYGKSNFRHKGASNDISKDFLDTQRSSNNEAMVSPEDQVRIEPPGQTSEYDWIQNPPDDFDNEYPMEIADGTIPYNQKQMLFSGTFPKTPNSRDPRSREKQTINKEKNSKALPENISNHPKSKKKNLSDKIYSYPNIRMSKKRLLHDADDLPTDILRDTYFKNEENRLRRSKFEQRDIGLHKDKIHDNVDVAKVIEEEKRSLETENSSLTLWDLENEKELQDRENDYYTREKRDAGYIFDSIPRVTSVGAVLDSLNATNSTNSIDLVFVKYWLPAEKNLQEFLKDDIEECISEKISQTSTDQAHIYEKTTETEQKKLFRKECEDEQNNLRKNFNFFNQLRQLRLGQMTVYRVKIECVCDTGTFRSRERCARFLKKDAQRWPQYLGKFGDGVF